MMSQISEFSTETQIYLKTLLTACAYAGSGNVLIIQEFINLVAKTDEELNPKVKQIAVIGIALTAMGEEIGEEMIFRTFDHFLQFGSAEVKAAIALALSLTNLSNPRIHITDLVTKLSYDSNKNVALPALLSLGLVGAGTNNSRLASNLRSISAYHNKDKELHFMTKIAQGLIYSGKGLLSLKPTSSNDFLINNVSLAGVLIPLLALTEGDKLFFAKNQYLIYTTCLSLSPRMVFTVNKDLEFEKIKVIVGTKVDTVGQAGNMREITGFQSHETPILLAKEERCEINKDDFLSYSEIAEGIVIVEKLEQDR